MKNSDILGQGDKVLSCHLLQKGAVCLTEATGKDVLAAQP